MTITIVKETHEESDPTIIKERTFKAELSGSMLFVYEIVEENGQQINKMIMTQPWKPNPDGTRSAWINEEDASIWLNDNF